MGVAMNHHPHLLDIANLAGYYFLGQTVFGNAIAQHTATLGFHLEYLDSKALAGQVAGNGDARGPGSDDSHLAACLLGNVLVGQLVVGVEVGHEAFQFSDVHRLALLAQHAVALTLFLVGTHAPADGGQIALGSDDADGIAHVAFLQLMYPVGDVVADGAALLALGHLAVQTALCLLDGLGHCVTLVDFFLKLHFSNSFPQR